MKSIENYVQIDSKDFLDELLFDPDIKNFVDENKLSKAMLSHSTVELMEFRKNKSKYDLIWNGMVELKLKQEVQIKNPGLTYLDKPIFKNNMILDDIDAGESKAEAVRLGWSLRREGFYLTGANGIGKTFYAVALANKRFESEHKTTLFVFWPDFVQNAKRFEKESYRMISQVKHAKYLIIDDLGQEFRSDYVRDEILNPIITYRLEKGLNTIITSNYEIDELYALYTRHEIDSKKVKSIISKMSKLCKPVKMVGEDLRSRQEK